MLELRDLCKSYGPVRAVDRVNLAIPEGEFFSLLGPSGCGKTTLLRMLGGFESPSSGQITLSGSRIDPLPANQRPFNMVFQRYALFPHLNVRENIAFGLKMKKIPSHEISSRIEEALALVKMQGYADRMISTLSGGQQQRIALARAVVNRPKVLLLDEPLSALDLKLRQQMQVELLAIQKKLRHTFIFVTHDQGEALTLSDRIAVMNHGVVEQVGTAEEIYENPTTSFVAQFIGSINTFDCTVESASSDVVTLGSSEGPSLHVKPSRARKTFPSLRSGESAHVLVRPEKIRISSLNSESNRPSGNVLEASLKEILYQGSMTQYLVITKTGKPVQVLQSNSAGAAQEEFRDGESLLISWDPGDSIVLARKSEKNEIG